MTKEYNNNFSISKSLTDLEKISNYLQSEDVDIDKAILEFKKGVKLAENIKKHLVQAENTVNKLKLDLEKTNLDK